MYSREDVRNDLRNGVTIDEVCRKYGLSFKELLSFLRVNSGISNDTRRDYKHIRPKGARFEVFKSINGKQIVFGRFIHYFDAKTLRDKCVEEDWDLSLVTNGDLYITLRNDRFYIERKGKSTYGAYEYLEDARKVRDKLIECNWRKSDLDSICKILGVEQL